LPGASAPAPDTAQPSDRLDVSDLEKKYWAAKDTDFNVVQNRLFSKAGKYTLTPYYAMLVNEPWSEGPTIGLAGNYYFSERYGVELSYSRTQSRDTEAAQRLRDQGGAPNHNKPKQFFGAAFNWVPFYAKMSVLNSKILYFDMAFSPGIGMVQYEQQLDSGGELKTAPALTFDVTQTFFLSSWMALRFEFKNRWYKEDVANYRAVGGAHATSSSNNQTSLLMFGATFYY
jgi:outer membrane beta-barrel protein